MKSLRPEKKWTTKLSSAGLVYHHFGEQVVAKVLGTTTDDPVTQTIYDKAYEFFIEEVDAIDNGVNQTDEKPRYWYMDWRFLGAMTNSRLGKTS